MVKWSDNWRRKKHIETRHHEISQDPHAHGLTAPMDRRMTWNGANNSMEPVAVAILRHMHMLHTYSVYVYYVSCSASFQPGYFLWRFTWDREHVTATEVDSPHGYGRWRKTKRIEGGCMFSSHPRAMSPRVTKVPWVHDKTYEFHRSLAVIHGKKVSILAGFQVYIQVFVKLMNPGCMHVMWQSYLFLWKEVSSHRDIYDLHKISRYSWLDWWIGSTC